MYKRPLPVQVIRFKATLVELNKPEGSTYRSDFIDAASVEQLEEHAIDLALYMGAAPHSQLHIAPVSEKSTAINWYTQFLGTSPKHFCHEHQQAVLDCRHPLRIWYNTKQQIVDLEPTLSWFRAADNICKQMVGIAHD